LSTFEIKFLVTQRTVRIQLQIFDDAVNHFPNPKCLAHNRFRWIEAKEEGIEIRMIKDDMKPTVIVKYSK
jgi:hypothetical protein